MKQTLLLIALVLFTLSSASAQTKYKEIDDISYENYKCCFWL